MFKYTNLYHRYFLRILIITRINNTIPTIKHNAAIIQIIKNAVIIFLTVLHFEARYCSGFRI